MPMLNITPKEALAIEQSLKGDDEAFRSYRGFLLGIGSCLLEQKPLGFELKERELWFLRDRVNPLLEGGLDLLLKVYKLLLEETHKKDLGILRTFEKFNIEAYKQDKLNAAKSSEVNEVTDASSTESQTEDETHSPANTEACTTN